MPVRDLILLFTICVFWAFNFITAAYGMQHFTPYLFTVLRFSFLLLLLLPFMTLPPRDQWLRLTVVCVCIGALQFGALFWALGLSADISSVAITHQTYIPMSVILAMVLLGEQVGWRTLTAIGVAFSGVALLSFDPVIFGQLAVVGIVLASAFFQALASVLMRRLRGLGMLSFQAWTAAISLPPLILGTLLADHGQLEMVRTAGWLDWGSVLFSTVGASIIGHGTYFYLVQRHPVSAVVPYMLMTPVLAVLFGVLMWGDRPGWRLLAGGALVLAGILAVTLRARQRNGVREPRTAR